jgi:hypothetical protein
LQDIRERSVVACKKVSNIFCMSSYDYGSMITNPQVEKYNTLDNRSRLVNLDDNAPPLPNDPMMQRMVRNGWDYMGTVKTLKGGVCYIFIPNLGYEKLTNNWTDPKNPVEFDAVDKGTLFAMSSRARFDRAFGPIEGFDPNDYNPEFVKRIERFLGLSVQPKFEKAPALISDGVLDARAFFLYPDPDRCDMFGLYFQSQSSAIYETTETDAIQTMDSLDTP